MLKDALKSKVPEAAPFPAGLYSSAVADVSKVDDTKTNNNNIEESPENNGDKVEN